MQMCIRDRLKATCDLNIVRDADLLVLSVPTIAVEELCIKIGALVEKPVIIVNTSKGFHPQTNERMSNVIRRFMPKDKLKSVVSLIGPSHAEEVVLRMLTTICAVSLSEEDEMCIRDRRVAAYAAVRGLRESYDLFAIHSCRKYLQEAHKQDADTAIETDQRDGETEEPLDDQQKEEPPKEWEELFQNTYFHFSLA